MFVSKEGIKSLLIERGLITASQFNERCQKKRWSESKYRPCYDLVKDHFGIERALNRNYIRTLVVMLNGDKEGHEFVSSKRSRLDMSYEENDSADESPLLDLNATVDMSIDSENVDPILAEKDRIIEGLTLKYFTTLIKPPK